MIDNKNIYRLIIDQLIGVAIVDSEGRYIYVNESWENMLGFKIEDIKGKENMLEI